MSHTQNQNTLYYIIFCHSSDCPITVQIHVKLMKSCTQNHVCKQNTLYYNNYSVIVQIVQSLYGLMKLRGKVPIKLNQPA